MKAEDVLRAMEIFVSQYRKDDLEGENKSKNGGNDANSTGKPGYK